jgi:prepilin-type N-terminal cleavage/methylation domain-containing protein
MLKKLRNKKGFTLAELLIVVAIIGVLVAISIPIFTAQLEKSRDAVTVANLRAAYAEAASDYLTSNGQAVTDGDVSVTAPSATDGSVVVTVSNVVVKGTNATDLSGIDKELPFDVSSYYAKLNVTSTNNGKVTVKFTYAKNAQEPTFSMD